MQFIHIESDVICRHKFTCFVYRFQVVSSHVIEFNNLALHAAVDGEDSNCLDFLHRVLSKDNVGLAVLLQTTPGAWSDNDCASPDSECFLSE